MLNTITMQDIKDASSDKTITEFNGKIVEFAMPNSDYDLVCALLDEKEKDLTERELCKRVIARLQEREAELTRAIKPLTVNEIARKIEVSPSEVRRIERLKFKGQTRRDRMAAL